MCGCNWRTVGARDGAVCCPGRNVISACVSATSILSSPGVGVVPHVPVRPSSLDEMDGWTSREESANGYRDRNRVGVSARVVAVSRSFGVGRSVPGTVASAPRSSANC